MATPILSLIFGSQYTAAAAILAIGMWRLPALSLSVLAGQALIAVGKQGLVMRTSLAGTLVSIALVIPLATHFGPTGAAVALLTRPLLTFVLRVPALAHHFPGFWPWRQLGRAGLALALMLVPLSWASGSDGVAQSVLLAILGVGLYVAGLAVMRVLPVQEISRYLGRRLGRGAVPGAVTVPSSPGME
jgi:O-antigen/teichoic acid export membrane protein